MPAIFNMPLPRCGRSRITACAKSSCRIAARVAGAPQWEQWAEVRLMGKELLRVRHVSRRN